MKRRTLLATLPIVGVSGCVSVDPGVSMNTTASGNVTVRTGEGEEPHTDAELSYIDVRGHDVDISDVELEAGTRVIYANGRLENTSEIPIERVHLRIRRYDENGDILHTGGDTEYDIDPGQAWLFSIALTDMEFAEYGVFINTLRLAD